MSQEEKHTFKENKNLCWKITRSRAYLYVYILSSPGTISIWTSAVDCNGGRSRKLRGRIQDKSTFSVLEHPWIKIKNKFSFEMFLETILLILRGEKCYFQSPWDNVSLLFNRKAKIIKTGFTKQGSLKRIISTTIVFKLFTDATIKFTSPTVNSCVLNLLRFFADSPQLFGQIIDGFGNDLSLDLNKIRKTFDVKLKFDAWKCYNSACMKWKLKTQLFRY